MWYLSKKSFWKSALLIVFLYLKLCKPQNPGLRQRKPNRGETPPDPILPEKPKKAPRPEGDIQRPQDMPPPWIKITPGTADGAAGKAAGDQKNRFTIKITTPKKYVRTTPMRVSFAGRCDYLAYYCLRAYDTGRLCGRTIYYGYYTFRNYCLLDYVNCMERFEVWQVVHMGDCFEIKILTEYLLYPYDDDYFLDQYYVLEEHK